MHMCLQVVGAWENVIEICSWPFQRLEKQTKIPHVLATAVGKTQLVETTLK